MALDTHEQVLNLMSQCNTLLHNNNRILDGRSNRLCSKCDLIAYANAMMMIATTIAIGSFRNDLYCVGWVVKLYIL